MSPRMLVKCMQFDIRTEKTDVYQWVQWVALPKTYNLAETNSKIIEAYNLFELQRTCHNIVRISKMR